MAATAETPAAVRAADSAATDQLRQADEDARGQMAIAKPYPAGRSMQLGALVPANLEEAVRVANLLCKSALIPKDMRERPADVLAALMLGADVGLAPMQALQSIAVINGRPSMWGDGMLAVVMAHPQFDDIAETWEDGEGGTAVCTVWRKGRRQPTIARFSHNDAQKAGLLSKDTYKNYEKRMLKMRARSWALRDTFPDALRGIVAAEEAQDIPAEVIASELVPMPERRSEQARLGGGITQEPPSTLPLTPPSSREPEAAALAPQSDEEMPAAADRIVECKKNGPSSSNKFWWTVVTARGVKAYTWSTTKGPQIEEFRMTGALVTLDTVKDSKGDNRIETVEPFDALGGAGREPGGEG